MNQETKSPLKIERPPQTLREMTLERMRTAIISGHFKSGERLVERPLCEQLGVSRSVVRETIRYLEAEGLVEILPNKGPIIARMDWTLAEQIYDIRCLLESNAARACARHADTETKAKLKKALDDLKKAYSNGETGKLFRVTTAFYEIIFASSRHDVAWEIVQRLNGRISRLRAMTLSTRDRHESGFARMEKIYSGIVNNDPEAAGQATEEHIREAAEIAKTLLTQNEPAL
ncbi:GntR family transcriptional regulator [Kiloniella sp. b19]|uniref:GntR family transcriptional regulator n=1 Tax=Kiloniella sp. GXU_MW_B19 TaxID=3141326 RepID=UPI0031DACDF6